MQNIQNSDEQELIRRLKNPAEQRAAFSQLVKQYSEPIYWHIRHMVLSHEDSNDLLQNTFMKAWTNIDRFRGDSQILTWLFRIAINETLTFLDRRKTTIPIDSIDTSVIEQLESDTYFNGDTAEANFQAAIQKLPPKQRMVFNMKYYDEMSYDEMSAILGTSIGALKASYHIAAKKIEEYLKENFR